MTPGLVLRRSLATHDDLEQDAGRDLLAGSGEVLIAETTRCLLSCGNGRAQRINVLRRCSRSSYETVLLGKARERDADRQESGGIEPLPPKNGAG